MLILLAVLYSPAPDPVIEAPVAEVSSAHALCEAATEVLPDMLYAPDAGYTDMDHPVVVARLDRCANLVAEVEDQGEDMMLTTLVVAYVESNFNPEAVGAAGERGMMQVLPKYHCVDAFSDGNGGCVDPEGAGIKFLTRLRSKHSPNDALRKYNGSQTYATKVLGYVGRVEAVYKG